MSISDDNLREEISIVLNKISRENHSNTPDFILAQCLLQCLQAFEVAVLSRDRWYGISPRPAQFRPRIVCLCGSTRFKELFDRVNFEETMAGRMVLSVGFFPGRGVHGELLGCDEQEKEALDVLHKHKIDAADEIFVINFNGYVGSSTKSEIQHAIKRGKPIRWLEPEAGERFLQSL